MSNVESVLQVAKSARVPWAEMVRRRRVKTVGRVAAQLAAAQNELVATSPRAVSAAEVLASEVLPLADACGYVAKIGNRTLAPISRPGRHGAWWLGRVGVNLVREPWGTVLILAPSNYPLFLAGVQAVQAVAAGNAVVLKPAEGSERQLARFIQCLTDAGIPQGLVQLLDADVAAGQQAIALGVDKVFLTGSVTTGREVLQTCSQRLTPVTLELSGCDAVFVTPQADLERTARCLAYGLQLNAGQTCIAPRRVFVTKSQLPKLSELLIAELSSQDRKFDVPTSLAGRLDAATQHALGAGAQVLFGDHPAIHPRRDSSAGASESRGAGEPLPASGAVRRSPLVLSNVQPTMRVVQEDLFAPLLSLIAVSDMAAALRADQACPYALGASVFGPHNYAEHWARKINAGCVVLNDIIVPTADPRVPFGGRGWSGWGTTRGIEGLLEMTRPKVTCSRKGRWLPHLNQEQAHDAELLGQMLNLFHSQGLPNRWRALQALIKLFRGL